MLAALAETVEAELVVGAKLAELVTETVEFAFGTGAFGTGKPRP